VFTLEKPMEMIPALPRSASNLPAMRAQRITTDFHRLGLLVSVAWAMSAVLILVVSLCAYCELISDVTGELGSVSAVVGALGIGFAGGNYAIALALGRIAIGLSLAVTEQLALADRRGLPSAP
jgi:hypothetical protein